MKLVFVFQGVSHPNCLTLPELHPLRFGNFLLICSLNKRLAKRFPGSCSLFKAETFCNDLSAAGQIQQCNQIQQPASPGAFLSCSSAAIPQPHLLHQRHSDPVCPPTPSRSPRGAQLGSAPRVPDHSPACLFLASTKKRAFHSTTHSNCSTA